jgi:peroxiredoxin
MLSAMRRTLLPLAALLVLAASAVAQTAAGPASSPAVQPAPAATPATAAAGSHVVVLNDGTRIPCTEPPLIALGRVLYRTADGARHALPAEKVNLELTRPTERQVGAAAAREPGAKQVSSAAPAPKPGAPQAAPAARREAPDFTAKRADGTEVKLSQLRGKVVLVDFWATWCGPCVAEMPNVKKLYAKHSGPHFEIVGVSLDRSRAELEAFMKAQGIAWPQAFDGKGWENAIARQYGVYSIPTMLLLDREGRVARAGVRGPMLEQAVAEVLAEAAPAKKPKPSAS